MTDRLTPNHKGFKIEWIPVKNLSIVWAASQRRLNNNQVQTIMDQFDPEMFGTIAVTKPNGQGVYHIIDGQHRKAAVERMWKGDEKVPCQVFDAEDPARAAQLFDHINSGRRRPQPIELFMVRVTAGYPLQVAVNKTVQACGFHVSSAGGKSHAVGGVSCVQALESVYESNGAEILTATLITIKETWGLEDTTAVSAYLIRGLGAFFAQFRHVDRNKLIQALSARFTAAQLMAASRASKDIYGGNLTLAVKEMILRTYNKIARGPKKLVPKKH